MTDSVFDEFRRRIGDPKEFRERLGRFGRNADFAFAHLEDWRLRYPDSWVGVYDEKLVAVAKSSEEILAVLRDKSIPLQEAFLRFISKEKYSLVL